MYKSVQRDFDLIVNPSAWTVVDGYNIVNADDGVTLAANGCFVIPSDGVWMFTAYTRWDYGPGERIMRFIRNPDTTPDDFGNNETIATNGSSFITNVYNIRATTGMQVGLQVWQNSGDVLPLAFAQFKLYRLGA